MLKLSIEEYGKALDAMFKAIEKAEGHQLQTRMGKAALILEYFGEDWDIAPMDMRDDTETDVWPEVVTDLERDLMRQQAECGWPPEPGKVVLARYWRD